MIKYMLAYAAYVAAMNTIPGPWRQWEKGEYVDYWTATHVAWGFAAKKMGVGLYELVALGILNEKVEKWLRENRPDLVWGFPETQSNVLVDQLATAGGWMMG